MKISLVPECSIGKILQERPITMCSNLFDIVCSNMFLSVGSGEDTAHIVYREFVYKGVL